MISYRTCGGGGYGPPDERDPSAGRARRARGQGQRRARPRALPRRGRPTARSTRSRPLACGAGRDRPDHLRGDPQRARRGDRRDGAGAQAQRVLDQHQDALGLLVRVLRRRAALRSRRGSPSRCTSARWSSRCRSAVRDYGPENLGPGDAILTNDPYPSGVHLNDVSLIAPVHCDGELLGYVANLAHHVDVGGGAPGEHRRLPRGLPGGRDHPAGQARRGRADRPRRLPAASSPRSAPSTRPPATSARRSRRTRPACAGCRRSSSGTGATTIVDDDGRAARLHRAPHARRARGAPARRLRGRGRRSTTTATPTSRCAWRRGSTIAPGRRPLRLRPAPTRSGARRSTRPTR